MECVLLRVGLGLLVLLGGIAGGGGVLFGLIVGLAKFFESVNWPGWLKTTGIFVGYTVLGCFIGSYVGFGVWQIGGAMLPKVVHFCIG